MPLITVDFNSWFVIAVCRCASWLWAILRASHLYLRFFFNNVTSPNELFNLCLSVLSLDRGKN